MPNIEELERCASNRQVRLNEAEAVELDPFITSEVPSGADGASQPGNATVQLVRLGAVADVVNLVIDDEAIDDANMLASASYVVVLCDDDIAKLSSAMLSFFGFDLLDEDQQLIVDRTFEVPAIDLWMECGLAGAYLAARYEYEKHTVGERFTGHWHTSHSGGWVGGPGKMGVCFSFPRGVGGWSQPWACT